MQEEFSAFVDNPSRRTARALHAQVRAQASFTADTPWFERCRTLLDQGRHDEVIRIIDDAMPGAFMSPCAHAFLSRAHDGIRASEAARREAFYTTVALDLIGASGDGSREHPWQVLHVADESAFLQSRDVSATRAHLVEMVGGRALEVLDCTDGRQRWFLAEVDQHD